MTKRKNTAAVALGKKRMARLTKAERSEFGRKAVQARWKRVQKGGHSPGKNKTQK